MSDSNLVQLAYIAESTFGVAVTSGNMQTLRHTGESLKQDSAAESSKEIRSDRQISGLKRTKISASGGINFELSYGTYDDLLKAALMADADWTSVLTATGTDIQAIASGNKYQSATDDDFKDWVVGSWVKIAGFTTAGNNGYAKIVSITHSDSPTTENNILTVSGLTLVDEAAGDSVTIKQGAYIKNGVTCPSFNIEKKYTDLTNVYSLLKGMCVDGVSLSVSAEAMIGGGITFMGANEVSAAASAAQGYDVATSTEVMSGVDNVHSILENQADFDATEFSFQLSNNLRSRLLIGNNGNTLSLGKGALNITGTLKAYFATAALMDKYLNFTASSLAFLVNDVAGNAYVFDFPEVKYTDGQRVAGGQSQDCISDMKFSASRDATENVTIRIVKFAA
ncbi:MAG TPA: hypothetical protein DDW84_01465 [Phycisphaerales bacterium]|nr:MAG: hypothetical protein A2Y13_01260 [Planctomycetes bacterium GWC2_45_44]HBG77505.1 hypothetical protein [Phycisphaerales bacterium]HBR19113.1 hypothetical protein [Phycisphaerales bacterium]